ncbi:riboflavin synthase, alpha subunit [Lentilactobacillus parafarraginis F0439]|uniref:Riboflavin synthase n=1 Tax=Lentilactobacillus parafarraginis F0439 TaxID=797515 RepID=G9ZR71_9LACO|nr:riboflavin synthase [Lentilactobacillus parafarraginis]EHL96864.1 riboflavin synthase, alpha subunit [Lentilactobacillus parafarraginis F0439]
MFTGIVQDQGRVVRVEMADQQAKLMIQTNLIQQPAFSLGDSVAVNGVCLTISAFETGGFTADVMPETMLRTNFKNLTVGDPVNLEPALAASDRLDGHFLLGHVDATATLLERTPDEDSQRLTFVIDQKYHPYIVEKGSIGINGISLTVVTTTPTTFEVALIPYTMTHTSLGRVAIGDQVNVETDILGKYVVNLAREGLANYE